MILFSWFAIDQRFTKENGGSRYFFLVSLQEAKSLSVRVSSSEFPAAFRIGELFMGTPCSLLRKNGVFSSIEVVDYFSSKSPVSSSWSWKELGNHAHGMGNIRFAPDSKLHQIFIEFGYKWRSNFSSLDSKNFVVVQWGSIEGVEFVSLWKEKVRTIVKSHTLQTHTDTQYVYGLDELFAIEFRLQQISKSFTGLLFFDITRMSST